VIDTIPLCFFFSFSGNTLKRKYSKLAIICYTLQKIKILRQVTLHQKVIASS
jgi:hypothetical protein